MPYSTAFKFPKQAKNITFLKHAPLLRDEFQWPGRKQCLQTRMDRRNTTHKRFFFDLSSSVGACCFRFSMNNQLVQNALFSGRGFIFVLLKAYSRTNLRAEMEAYTDTFFFFLKLLDIGSCPQREPPNARANNSAKSPVTTAPTLTVSALTS